MTNADIDRKHQENLERLKIFRLIDDDFFTECFEDDIKCIELVPRIVLDMSDSQVISIHVQVFVANLLNRSVRLDMLATGGRSNQFSDPKRKKTAQYHLFVYLISK